MFQENPIQWKPLLAITPGIQKKEIKPFFILALKELEGTPDNRISKIISIDKYAAIRCVLRHMARLRSASKEAWAKEDVDSFLEGLRFTPECALELSKLLCTEQVYENIPRHLCVKPGLAGLQWRIDVSLWQSNLNEATTEEVTKDYIHQQIFVILVLTLTNNQILKYRLTLGKFHELRFSIANALKNMIVLERRKCMRKD